MERVRALPLGVARHCAIHSIPELGLLQLSLKIGIPLSSIMLLLEIPIWLAKIYSGVLELNFNLGQNSVES